MFENVQLARCQQQPPVYNSRRLSATVSTPLPHLPSFSRRWIASHCDDDDDGDDDNERWNRFENSIAIPFGRIAFASVHKIHIAMQYRFIVPAEMGAWRDVAHSNAGKTFSAAKRTCSAFGDNRSLPCWLCRCRRRQSPPERSPVLLTHTLPSTQPRYNNE